MAVELKMEIAKDEILPACDALIQAIGDFRKAFKKAEAHMIGSIEQNFEEGGRPTKWAPWKNPKRVLYGRLYRLASYRRAKREKRAEMRARAYAIGGRILLDTGTLRRSVTGRSPDYTTKLDKFEFRMGTRLKYAPVHQYGSTKKHIPARPFLLFQKEDVEAIREIFRRYILETIERGGRR